MVSLHCISDLLIQLTSLSGVCDQMGMAEIQANQPYLAEDITGYPLELKMFRNTCNIFTRQKLWCGDLVVSALFGGNSSLDSVIMLFP